MAIDYGQMVYSPTFDVFARTVTITPLKSQPNSPAAYTARGIYSSQPIDVPLEESTVFSDSAVVLDIIESEFSVLPVQGDLVSVPSSGDIAGAGDFEVADSRTNGGGETTLVLRRQVGAKP